MAAWSVPASRACCLPTTWRPSELEEKEKEGEKKEEIEKGRESRKGKAQCHLILAPLSLIFTLVP